MHSYTHVDISILIHKYSYSISIFYHYLFYLLHISQFPLFPLSLYLYIFIYLFIHESFDHSIYFIYLCSYPFKSSPSSPFYFVHIYSPASSLARYLLTSIGPSISSIYYISSTSSSHYLLKLLLHISLYYLYTLPPLYLYILYNIPSLTYY